MGERRRLRPVEELLELGFERHDLVIINEAHDGHRRCVRTRRVGERILPTADRIGVRHLAMEALYEQGFVDEANSRRAIPPVPGPSYLAQPEMRSFIQSALDLGWTLHGYEAGIAQTTPEWDPMSMAFTNWREATQAENLADIVRALPAKTRALVWCGNHHQLKVVVDSHPEGPWYPMGWRLVQRFGLTPFVIDQAATVEYRRLPRRMQTALRALRPDLEVFGGSGGYLAAEAPEPWCREGADAVVLSLDNKLE